MKKLFMLLVVAAITFFVSCEGEPSKPPEPPVSPEEPFPLGTWRTTNQYFGITLDEEARPEGIKEVRERVTSDAIDEDESYRLEFRIDGTGYGSGVLPDGTGRWEFDFEWQLSDDELRLITTDAEDRGVFFHMRISLYGYYGSIIDNADTVEDMVWYEIMAPMREIIWEVEESSAGEMVLSTSQLVFMMGSYPDFQFVETHIHRYTFEKVE